MQILTYITHNPITITSPHITTIGTDAWGMSLCVKLVGLNSAMACCLHEAIHPVVVEVLTTEQKKKGHVSQKKIPFQWKFLHKWISRFLQLLTLPRENALAIVSSKFTVHVRCFTYLHFIQLREKPIFARGDIFLGKNKGCLSPLVGK